MNIVRNLLKLTKEEGVLPLPKALTERGCAVRAVIAYRSEQFWNLLLCNCLWSLWQSSKASKWRQNLVF